MQEVNSLNRVNDSFRKIVVIKDNIIPWYDDDGIYYIGIEKFLLGEETGR
jgi:predicted AAA+ superfamily ATPase